MMEENSYRIALLLPYFGQFPNYFQLWLDSAKYNKYIDFLIITDSDMQGYQLSYNIHVIKMTFHDVKKRVSKILPYSYKLNTPYKLCDYRPIFGIIFEDFLKNYDFWGHCDPDVIWGDLSKFVTHKILGEYDRIYTLGHLTIYRNDTWINYSALNKSLSSFINSKHVYTSNYSSHFDEGKLLRNLQEQIGMRIYEKVDCADVLYDRKPFVILKEGENKVDFFEYNMGHIYGYTSEVKKEYSYVHLQKRKMEVFCNDSLHYYIFPNSFINLEEKEEIWKTCLLNAKHYAHEQRSHLFWRRVNNIKQGAIVFRFLDLLSKLYYHDGKK